MVLKASVTAAPARHNIEARTDEFSLNPARGVIEARTDEFSLNPARGVIEARMMNSPWRNALHIGTIDRATVLLNA